MAFGGQFFSISQSGTMIFGRPLKSTVGGVLVDLVSAPIPAGDYELQVETAAGGIQVFLPRYALFTVEGGAGFGGQDVKRGPQVWQKLARETQNQLNLPPNPPEEATRESNPEQPVRIRLNLHTGFGGINVYQL